MAGPAARCYSPRAAALWRNWQTQQTQNLPLFGASRFDSGEGHQPRLLRDRHANGGGVVPRFHAAAVVRDLAVGEEPADGNVAHHRADRVDLLLELLLEDQPPADAVEEQDPRWPGPLQIRL